MAVSVVEAQGQIKSADSLRNPNNQRGRTLLMLFWDLQAGFTFLPPLRGKVRIGVPVSWRYHPYLSPPPSRGRKSEFRATVRVGLFSALIVLLPVQLTSAFG